MDRLDTIFINEDSEKNIQRHLSSEINILIFDENSGFTKRKDNKIDAFWEILLGIWNVYMRKD